MFTHVRTSTILPVAVFVLPVMCAVAEIEPVDMNDVLHAPAPEYPSFPSMSKPRGKGMFVLHVDVQKGIVTSVDTQKSTGSAMLDQAAVKALRHWRFKPSSTPALVAVPVTFKL